MFHSDSIHTTLPIYSPPSNGNYVTLRDHLTPRGWRSSARLEISDATSLYFSSRPSYPPFKPICLAPTTKQTMALITRAHWPRVKNLRRCPRPCHATVGRDSRGRKKRAGYHFALAPFADAPDGFSMPVLTMGDARELPCAPATDGWAFPSHHRASIVRWHSATTGVSSALHWHGPTSF